MWCEYSLCDVWCLYVGCGPGLCGITLPRAFVLGVLGSIISILLLSVIVADSVQPLLLIGLPSCPLFSSLSVIGVVMTPIAIAAVVALSDDAFVSFFFFANSVYSRKEKKVIPYKEGM